MCQRETCCIASPTRHRTTSAHPAIIRNPVLTFNFHLAINICNLIKLFLRSGVSALTHASLGAPHGEAPHSTSRTDPQEWGCPLSPRTPNLHCVLSVTLQSAATTVCPPSVGGEKVLKYFPARFQRCPGASHTLGRGDPPSVSFSHQPSPHCSPYILEPRGDASPHRRAPGSSMQAESAPSIPHQKMTSSTASSSGK